MISQRILLVTGSLTIALIASAARAETPPAGAPAPAAGAPAGQRPPPKWMVFCKDDVEKLCKDAMAKGGVVQCLGDHEDALSEGCRDNFLANFKIAQLCKADFEKICKAEVEKGGKLGTCAKAHEQEFSEPCRKALIAGSKAAKKRAAAQASAAEKAESKKK